MIQSLLRNASELLLELTLTLYRIRKPSRFREWVELEEKKGKIIRAVEEGNPDFSKNLASFLSTALNISPRILLSVRWTICIQAFYVVAEKNAPRILLPLIVEYSREKKKEEGWDYDGRLWHLYSHLLAKAYGWNLDYISNMQVDEALAKVQEILTDEQLDREFIWASSEVAYSYDSRSKTTKFVPLTRPYWMLPRVMMPKKTKMLKSLVPIGMVDYKAIGEENAPQEIKH